MQTRKSQIQEQPWNLNSACWNTLHKLIFNWKFQLLEYWQPLENLEKVIKIQHQCEWISKIPLRGWWAWKNWFLIITTFLASANFWPVFQIWWIKKRAGAKNVVIIKNQFFHACQPCKGIFEIHSHRCCDFTTFFPELLMAASIPGVEIFSWKSAYVVFFNMQNVHWMVLLNLREPGLT